MEQQGQLDEKWYGATLLLLCRVNHDAIGRWTCDEQVRVVRAHDEETARQKAEYLERKEEHSYNNVYGEVVSWEFIATTNIYDIDDETIADGTEISSRLHEVTSLSSLRRSLE